MNVLTRNNVRVFGDGTKPMLFAHGYGCDQNMWRFVAPSFAADHRVVLFDHVGAGKSDKRAWNAQRYASLHGYASDVLDIVRELDLRDVTFVGHSVSAMIGMLAAIEEPARFDKLVMVGPSACYINDGDYVGGFSKSDIEGLLQSLEANFLGWSSTMAPVIMGNKDRPELAAELTNSFCQQDPEIAEHFARVTFFSDNRADVPKVKTKSLILQCAEDVIAPEAVGRWLQRHLPNNTFVQMKATGHCPNLSAPEETTAAIRAFL
jgi:sigma-B regulation protein RsbQ